MNQTRSSSSTRRSTAPALEGRTALVVGASRGIGAAAAVALADAGARVAITARTAEALQTVADQLAGTGAAVHIIAADVTDAAAAHHVVAETGEVLGPVDVLVYAAGQSAVGPFEQFADEEWERLFAVNVLGAVRFARAVLPGMKSRGWGRIINIASTAAKYGSRLQSPYNTSKHALLGMTRCLALETAGTGVTVNAVCPGFVDTEMVASAVPEMARHLDVADADVIPTLVKRVPIGRMLHSDEVAALITYLASPSAAGMTGQGVTLDGGLILV